MKTTLLATLITISLGIGLTATAQAPAAARGGRPAALQSAPLPKDDAEKKAIEVLQEIGQRRGMSAPRDDARLLRVLIESTGAKQAVELGTFRGYSSIWMALGLRSTGGKLITFEIDKNNAETSRQHFKRAGVEEFITIIEGDAHENVKQLQGPIDFVFIDADKEGYLDYLNQLLPKVRSGGLVVAHNMTVGMADPAFVKAITTNSALETLFVNAGNDGISISMKKR